MHRFYLRPESWQNTVLTLEGKEAHHGLRVLRLRKGDRVAVLDGTGHEGACEVVGFSRQAIRLQLLEKRSLAPPPCRLTLAQAVPKGKAMEWIVQKAVELGASRIVPLVTERSVPHHTAGGEAKAQKWRLTAIEAIKQCGALWLPQIEAPAKLVEFLAKAENPELSLLCSLQPGALHPRECFTAFGAKRGRPPETLWLWVGPEGDFTSGEIATLQSKGAVPITLGPLVLRAETAAIYCLSIVNYELQASPGFPGALFPG